MNILNIDKDHLQSLKKEKMIKRKREIKEIKKIKKKDQEAEKKVLMKEKIKRRRKNRILSL